MNGIVLIVLVLLGLSTSHSSPPLVNREDFGMFPELSAELSTPNSWDWGAFNVLSDPINIRDCAFVWAAPIVTDVAFLHARGSGGDLVVLSMQNLLDCANVSHPCNGGLPSAAYEYAISPGIVSEESYGPWQGIVQECHSTQGATRYKLSGYYEFSADEDALKTILFTNGPFVVCIQATWVSLYESGVYVPEPGECEQGIDTCVYAVAYGVEGGVPYWKLMFSFGEGFGENGYVRIVRGQGACFFGNWVLSGRL